MDSTGKSVRAATREAEFALDLIDLIELTRRSGSPVTSAGKLRIQFDDFLNFKYRGKDVAAEAADRAWERWKSDLRARNLMDGAEPPVEIVEGRRLVWPIIVDVNVATRWGEEAIARAKTIAEDKARTGIPSKAPVSVRIKRDASVKSALESLGIKYTPTRLRLWRERGAPFTKVKRGTRELYFTSVQELEDWINRAVAAGDINDPFEDRIPFEEARSRILTAIEKSGMTKLEFANRLDLNYGVLQSYVSPASKVRTVPVEVVLKAEEFAKTSPGSDRSSKFSRAGSPPLSTVKAALKTAGGHLTAASRLLTERGFTGVSPENVRYVAKKHGIPYVTAGVVTPNKTGLLAALVRFDFNLTKTAEHFGISASTVSRLIDRHGLREAVGPHLRAPTADEVKQALEVASDTTTAGELLGVSDSRFRALVSHHGLGDLFTERSKQWREGERDSEREELSSALDDAIKAGETRNDLARRLGMKRTSVEAAVRRLGLRDRYNELRYEVGGKARGSGRELDPGSALIPFWLAALRVLRSELGYGGNKVLAERLGVAGGVVVGNWLSGKRVPRYDMIEKIVGMAGVEMPDWRGKLRRAADEEKDYRAAAESLGIERGAFYSLLHGHVKPSEKMLEVLLGDEFWVEVT